LNWLTGRLAPDFKTIARFRKDNGRVIHSVCRQFVMLCQRLDLFAEALGAGIGPILASIIVLEVGSIERFASAGNFASYARCVDSQHMSNGKKKGEGNIRSGNKYLSWAFIEAANFALRFCAEARRFYERKKARANPILARKSFAHKLARACSHIL
jgi:transposase